MMAMLTKLSTISGLAAGDPILEHVLPQKLTGPLFQVGRYQFYLNNHMVMMLIAAFLMLLIFPMMAAQTKKDPVPRGMRNFFEAIMSFMRTEVFRPSLGDNTDRFAPFLWTMFFFILFCNLIGLVPLKEVLELIRGEAHVNIPAFGGTATGNIMVTAALAIVAFLAFHINGVWQQIKIQMDPSLAPHHAGVDHAADQDIGLGGGGFGNNDVKIDHHPGDGHDHAHGLHHAPQGKAFPAAAVLGAIHYVKSFVPPVPVLLWPVMLVLEIIGAIIKPFSLCIRLFANMLAGHMVLAAIVGLIFLGTTAVMRGGLSVPIILFCAVFSILEVFVAFLQAYIFTFLTTLFLAAAVAPEH